MPLPENYSLLLDTLAILNAVIRRNRDSDLLRVRSLIVDAMCHGVPEGERIGELPDEPLSE